MSPEASSHDEVLRALPQVLPDAVEFYLDVHRSPELSGAEERTAGLFAARLAGHGYEVTGGVGGHGVVAVLRNGEGPVVLLRAELDALPVPERTGLPYASGVTTADGGALVPVMHACGHDMHLACLAGTARLLARAPRCWRGTLVVVGQPAEETLTGARAMLADGLYERFPAPGVVLAQHTAPLPAGMVAHSEGLMLSAGAMLEVVVHGRGGHAGTAHLAVNPVVVAAGIVRRIEAAVARDIAPGDHVVVTVGALNAGTRGNIVPETAALRISVRAPGPQGVESAIRLVRRAAEAQAREHGCPRAPEVDVAAVSPPTAGDPETVRAVREAHTRAFGPGRVTGWPPSPATEDFPLYGDAGLALHGVPGVRTGYWMLGSVGPRQWAAAGDTAAAKLAALPANHSPHFAPDVRLTTPAGITALTAAALSRLAAPDPRAGG
jgi:amidohydrolase